jgi:hypothetical protein
MKEVSEMDAEGEEDDEYGAGGYSQGDSQSEVSRTAGHVSPSAGLGLGLKLGHEAGYSWSPPLNDVWDHFGYA